MTRFFKIFGTILIAGVILLCLPIALPQMAGMGAYDVISGSMEPALSVGTLVYTKSVDFQDISTGDVIAFSSGSSVVTHRVVEIDSADLLFTTKGDANDSNDPTPVAYTNVIGKVVFSLPLFGSMAGWLSELSGKVCAFILVALGCILLIVSDKMKELDKSVNNAGSESVEPKKKSAPKDKKSLGILIAGILIVVAGAGYAFFYMKDYNDTNQLYSNIENDYVNTTTEDTTTELAWYDMLTVDFDSLKAVNPDIVGWVYVENTDISYPIMYSGDDDYYLHISFDGSTSKAGSIFLEGLNSPDFSDAHTVIYGHNMRNLSMFGSLKYYKTEDNYEIDHQNFQIITPEGKMRYSIISYFDTDPGSWVYQVPTYEDGMSAFIGELVKANYSRDVLAADSYDDNSKIVTLSTCSTTGKRFTVNGILFDSTIQ